MLLAHKESITRSAFFDQSLSNSKLKLKPLFRTVANNMTGSYLGKTTLHLKFISSLEGSDSELNK